MRSFFSVILCFLFFFVSPGWSGDFVFGVVAGSDIKETFFRFKPLTKALEKALHKKIRLEPLPWPKFEDSFRKGRFHLAVGSSGCFLLSAPYRGRWVLKDSRRPVVVFRGGGLARRYKGKKAAVWPYSYEGYLAQADYLSRKFGRFDPREVLFLSSGKLVVLAVLNGKVDVGWVSLRTARKYGKSLRVVEIPGEERWVLFIRRDLPASTVSVLDTVLRNFQRSNLRFEPLSNPPDLSSLRRFLP